MKLADLKSSVEHKKPIRKQRSRAEASAMMNIKIRPLVTTLLAGRCKELFIE